MRALLLCKTFEQTKTKTTVGTTKMAKTKMKNEGLEPKREQTRKFKETRPNSLGNWASQTHAWMIGTRREQNQHEGKYDQNEQTRHEKEVWGPKENKRGRPRKQWPNSLGNWASQNSAWVGRDENRVKTTVVGTTDMANIDMKNEGLGPEREHTRKTEGNDSIS